MTAEVTVGIDIGTTSVKAVAADGDGTIVARARVPHRLLVPAPDMLEHDAVEAWAEGPVKALAALGVDEPLAVAVSAMVPSMTAVDRAGRPVVPGLLYGDARGRHAQSTSTVAPIGEAAEFVKWCAGEAPDAHGYWSAPAVANYALGGEAAVDFGTAFTTSPLFGAAMAWDEAVLADVGARLDQMPRVEMMGTAIGRVTGSGTILAGGSIDAMAEQIVAGADDDGDVLVHCGTTMIVWAVISDERQGQGTWTIPHTTPGKLMIGGPSNAGGLFLNWVLSFVGEGPTDVDDPWRVPVWEPYVRGERVPYHDADRRAVLHDLDLTEGPNAVRRAAYEAAGFVTRHILDLGAVTGRRIVATGGGTRVGPWMQALADCTCLPVHVAAVPEGAALGGAFLARQAAGLETSMTDAARWASTDHIVEPAPEYAVPVAHRYEKFLSYSERGEG
ncbi:MAG: D-xylulose kinase XylB [Acidimicrobiales bacterium]|nr:D-xylulose kinase XylB [Acidimicrobiales bacterium]